MKIFERTCRKVEQIAKRLYKGKSFEELCKGGKELLHKYEGMINQRLEELTNGEIEAGWLVRTGNLRVGFRSPAGFCLFGQSSNETSYAIEERNETVVREVLDKKNLYSHIDPKKELVFYPAKESCGHGFRTQAVVGVNPKTELFVFSDYDWDRYCSIAVKKEYNINNLLEDFVPKVAEAVNEANRILDMPEIRNTNDSLSSIQKEIDRLESEKLELRVNALRFADKQLKDG